MLKIILYLSIVFSFLGLVYLIIKACKIHFNEKLLNKISDDVKSELRKSPSYSLMDEENKREFKKANIKEVLSCCGMYLTIIIAVFLIFFVTSIIITGKGDTSLFSYLLWGSMPAVLIFIYFAGKDGLRAARFRNIYEIRAFCAEINIVHTGQGVNSKEVSLVYYDYKKMQYCITSIILSAGHDDWGYSTRFCWAMAVERGESIKVIDISPREYEE